MLYSSNFSLGEVLAVKLAKDAVASCFALKLSVTVGLQFFSNCVHIIGLSVSAQVASLHKEQPQDRANNEKCSKSSQMALFLN